MINLIRLNMIDQRREFSQGSMSLLLHFTHQGIAIPWGELWRSSKYGSIGNHMTIEISHVKRPDGTLITFGSKCDFSPTKTFLYPINDQFAFAKGNRIV